MRKEEIFAQTQFSQFIKSERKKCSSEKTKLCIPALLELNLMLASFWCDAFSMTYRFICNALLARRFAGDILRRSLCLQINGAVVRGDAIGCELAVISKCWVAISMLESLRKNFTMLPWASLNFYSEIFATNSRKLIACKFVDKHRFFLDLGKLFLELFRSFVLSKNIFLRKFLWIQ